MSIDGTMSIDDIKTIEDLYKYCAQNYINIQTKCATLFMRLKVIFTVIEQHGSVEITSEAHFIVDDLNELDINNFISDAKDTLWRLESYVNNQ